MSTFNDLDSPMKPTSFGPLKLIVDVYECNRQTHSNNGLDQEVKKDGNCNTKRTTTRHHSKEKDQKSVASSVYSKNSKENTDPVLWKANLSREDNTSEKREKQDHENLKQKVKQLEMEVQNLKSVVHQLKEINESDYSETKNEKSSVIENKLCSSSNKRKSETKNTLEENKNVNFEPRVEVLSNSSNGQTYSSTTMHMTSEKASRLRQTRMSTPHPTRNWTLEGRRSDNFFDKDDTVIINDTDKTPTNINSLRNILTPQNTKLPTYEKSMSGGNGFLSVLLERSGVDNHQQLQLQATKEQYQSQPKSDTQEDIVKSLDLFMSQMLSKMHGNLDTP